MQHDARRLDRFARVAILLSGTLGAVLCPLPGAADQVVEAGFYRTMTDHACAQEVPNGARVPMGELAKDAGGHRVIYFCTLVDVEHAKYLILSLGRGVAVVDDGHVNARVQSRSTLPDPVFETARTFRVGDLADVLNFVVEVGERVVRHRAAAFLYVSSYGPLLATVADPEGQQLPGMTPRRIEIVP